MELPRSEWAKADCASDGQREWAKAATAKPSIFHLAERVREVENRGTEQRKKERKKEGCAGTTG